MKIKQLPCTLLCLEKESHEKTPCLHDYLATEYPGGNYRILESRPMMKDPKGKLQQSRMLVLIEET